MLSLHFMDVMARGIVDRYQHSGSILILWL